MSAALFVKHWKKGQLRDLVFLQRGFDITQAQQTPGPYPVISSSGITSHHAEFKAAGPGVVIGRKGTLGSVHFSEGDYWPHDTTLWSKDLRDNNPRFVYYYLHTVNLKWFDVGNSNPTLNRNHIHDLPVLIPPPNIQDRIADILSAYDDLIANSRRRMELLEDATQELYREWFVRLRFPGREHTRIINGVPDGWERLPIGEVAPLNYGKALKEDNRVDGTVPVYGSSGVVGTHDKPLVNGFGIIVGRKGNVGSVFWSEQPFWAIDTVYFVSPECSSLYLFHCLQNVPFQSSDVAVPGLNRTYAHSLKILLPKRTIRKEFEHIVGPMFDQMSKLRSINEKLRAARDLLLPRLMSGEIAV